MSRISRLTFISLLMVAQSATAGILLDLNYGGASLAMSSPKSRNNSSYFLRPGAFLNTSQMPWLFVGAAIGLVNQSAKNTQTDTYSATDYMFGVKLSPFKTNWLWLGAYICPASTAVFKTTGSPKETWTGTSMVGSISAYYPVIKGLLMGFSLDYYSASYSKSTTASTATSVSQTVSGFYPSISIGYLF